jgi:hypothetical protein
MELERSPTESVPALGGAVRLAAVVLVLALAAIGILAVLDVLPKGVASEYAMKSGLVGGIVVAALALVAIVVRGGRR